jgi:hypothetical protein
MYWILICILVIFLLYSHVVKERFECLGVLDRNIYDTDNKVNSLSKLRDYYNFCNTKSTADKSDTQEESDTCFQKSRFCGSFCDTSPYPDICRTPELLRERKPEKKCVPSVQSETLLIDSQIKVCPNFPKYPYIIPNIETEKVRISQSFPDPPI